MDKKSSSRIGKKGGSFSYGLDLWNATLFIAIIAICFWIEFSKSTLEEIVKYDEPYRPVLISSKSKDTLAASPTVLYDTSSSELVCNTIKVGNTWFDMGNTSNNGIFFADSDDKAAFNPKVYVNGSGVLNLDCKVIVKHQRTVSNLYPVLLNKTIQRLVELECPTQKNTVSLLRYRNDKIGGDALNKYALIKTIDDPERSLLSSDGDNMSRLDDQLLTMPSSFISCVLTKNNKQLHPISWDWTVNNILSFSVQKSSPDWRRLPTMFSKLPHTGLNANNYAVVSQDGTEITGHEVRKFVDLKNKGAKVTLPNAKISIPHLVRLDDTGMLTEVPFVDPPDTKVDVISLWGLYRNNRSGAIPGEQITITYDPLTLFPPPNAASSSVRLVLFDSGGKAKLSDDFPLPSGDQDQQILKKDKKWYSKNDFLIDGNVRGNTVKNVGEPEEFSDAVPWQCFISINDRDLMTAHGKSIKNVFPGKNQNPAVTVKTTNEYAEGLILKDDRYHDAGNNVISNVGAPIKRTDAATMKYVNSPRYFVEYKYEAGKSDWVWANYNPSLYEDNFMTDTGKYIFLNFPCCLIKIDSLIPGLTKIEIVNPKTGTSMVSEEKVTFPLKCNYYFAAGDWIHLKTPPVVAGRESVVYLTFAVLIDFLK